MLQPLTKAKTSLCRSIWSLSTWTGLQLLQASDIGFGVQEIDRWKQNNTFWLNNCCFCDDVFQRSDFLSLSLGVKDGDLSIIAHCRVSPHENNRQNNNWIILNLLQNRIKKMWLSRHQMIFSLPSTSRDISLETCRSRSRIYKKVPT